MLLGEWGNWKQWDSCIRLAQATAGRWPEVSVKGRALWTWDGRVWFIKGGRADIWDTSVIDGMFKRIMWEYGNSPSWPILVWILLSHNYSWTNHCFNVWSHVVHLCFISDLDLVRSMSGCWNTHSCDIKASPQPSVKPGFLLQDSHGRGGLHSCKFFPDCHTHTMDAPICIHINTQNI